MIFFYILRLNEFYDLVMTVEWYSLVFHNLVTILLRGRVAAGGRKCVSISVMTYSGTLWPVTLHDT